MVALPELIYENTPRLRPTKHDQLYKELINTFFMEFLDVFFPEVHAYIDAESIKPIADEVYTDLIEGETRRLDLVVEAKVKGEDIVVIVHIEPQSYVQYDFNERMFHYFGLLYNKYRKPIIPIAVLSHEENWEKDAFSIEFPFIRVLDFKYFVLHLRKQRWRDFIRSDNPVAAALLGEMGYEKDEKIQVKKEFLRMMTRMELDPARQRLIYGIFETYLKLTDTEEEQLMAEIEKLPEAEKIMELPISYEEKGKEIGKVSGKREVAVEMLKDGVDEKLIAKFTQFSIEEIREFKKEL